MLKEAENKVGCWYVVKDVAERQISVLSEVVKCLGCLLVGIWNQGCVKSLFDIAILQLLINIDKVIYIDLSTPIKIGDKKHFKRNCSKLNQFYQRVVVKALKTVVERFDKVSVAVNVACTSQIDFVLGLLLVKRHGNELLQFWRGVFHVIHNARRNVKVRGSDSGTILYTKCSQVFRVLTLRTVKCPVDVVLGGLQVFIKSTEPMKDSVKKAFFKVWTSFLLGAFFSMGSALFRRFRDSLASSISGAHRRSRVALLL